jgi:polyhydroxyalkanoate synthesis repressor PhaR
MARTKDHTDGDSVVIKKYANRRLYNTATSSYVTLDHLSQMVKDGVEFAVFDAKTGEDITRSVLTQIIVEEESKGANLLPINFLRKLIGFYGDSLQGFVPRYLEMSMENFAHNQEQMRDAVAKTFSQMFPFAGAEQSKAMEDMVKNNMTMFQRAMEMFYPQSGVRGGGAAPADRDHPGAADDHDLEGLRREINALKQQLDTLAKKSD